MSWLRSGNSDASSSGNGSHCKSTSAIAACRDSMLRLSSGRKSTKAVIAVAIGGILASESESCEEERRENVVLHVVCSAVPS